MVTIKFSGIFTNGAYLVWINMIRGKLCESENFKVVRDSADVMSTLNKGKKVMKRQAVPIHLLSLYCIARYSCPAGLETPLDQARLSNACLRLASRDSNVDSLIGGKQETDQVSTNSMELAEWA